LVHFSFFETGATVDRKPLSNLDNDAAQTPIWVHTQFLDSLGECRRDLMGIGLDKRRGSRWISFARPIQKLA
jgi:hypothetical protein